MTLPCFSEPLRKWLPLTLLGICLVAATFAEWGLSQGSAKLDPRIAALRRDPARHAQLLRDAKNYFALPAARQEALRKLDQDLQGLTPGERKALLATMTRYGEWLDSLPAAERQAILDAPDARTRLARIKSNREQKWLARQPLAIRQQVDKLAKLQLPPALQVASSLGMLVGSPRGPRVPGGPVTALTQLTDWRGDWIARLKHESAQHQQDWLIASNFWEDLKDIKRPLPTNAIGFSAEVDLFVKEYLRPLLSKDEADRLAKAEGHWPLYPVTLVELADRHPLALPSPNGPAHFTELPKSIQAAIKLQFEKKGKGTANPENFFLNAKNLPAVTTRLKALGEARLLGDIKPNNNALKFTCSVAGYARTNGIKISYEMWPTKPSELDKPMREFLDPKGPFLSGMTEQERLELVRAEDRWPEFPLKIKYLAERYGFRPPWQVLPMTGSGKNDWDSYRVKTVQKVRLEPPLPDPLFWVLHQEPDLHAGRP